MINYVWLLMIVCSVVCGIFNGTLNLMTSAILDGIQNAIEFVMKMMATMCFWSGIMSIAEDSGLNKIVGKVLSPVLKLIFPRTYKDKEAFGYLTMNVSANLLGLGNAATPIGLKAIAEMNKSNSNKGTATNEMILLIVMNTASITILPTTVAMLRSQAGSKNPMEILPAVIITSFLALTIALTACRVCESFKKK